jgi:hypothetical protein
MKKKEVEVLKNVAGYGNLRIKVQKTERNEKKKIHQNVAGYVNIKKSPKTWQVPEKYENNKFKVPKNEKNTKKLYFPKNVAGFRKTKNNLV